MREVMNRTHPKVSVMTGAGRDRILPVIERVHSKANRVLEAFGVALFLSIFVVVLLQVFMRYVVGSPLVWSEELARYLFVWVSFIGWVFATRNGTHIRIAAMVEMLPEWIRRGTEILNHCLELVFSLALGWLGSRMVAKSVDVPTVTLFFSYAVVYLVVPVSSLLIAFDAAVHILRRASGKGGVHS